MPALLPRINDVDLTIDFVDPVYRSDHLAASSGCSPRVAAGRFAGRLASLTRGPIERVATPQQLYPRLTIASWRGS